MSFDLDINNYTRDELIDMFELPLNYDKNIVEIKELQLRDNIINNNEISKETQLKTINFLIKAKNIILNEKNNTSKCSTNLQEKIAEFYNSSYELKSSEIEDSSEHMVQVRKEKPYLSTYPSEFFPGIINPLKKRTIKKVLNVDSRFRENYYNSSSTNYNIALPINLNSVIQMQLASVELSTSFYVISKQYGNNYFSISVDGNQQVITIPDGNYDQTTIYGIINNQLTNLGAPFNNVSFIINLTNGTTGSGQTMVGENAPGTITSLSLNFQTDINGITNINEPLPLKLGWILGFRNGNYINNLNYVSEGILDLTGPKYLYLVVDDHNNNVNNSFYSAFNSSILNKNILARISMQTNTFGLLEQNNFNLISIPREYFGPINLTSFTVQLLDEYGRIVNLNNMDFSFCLNLTTIYDL